MSWPHADHYRKRAEELRAAAEHMADRSAKENLLELARQYEEMAEKTAKPDGGSPKSP